MSARIRALQRLADVYGMVERMRSVDLRIASVSVAEAGMAGAAQRQAVHDQVQRGRRAMNDGDSGERLLAQAQGAISAGLASRVEQLRRAREVVREKVELEYRASRVRLEQMQHVVDAATEVEMMATQRRLQAEMDDRHLSRKLWIRGRVGSNGASE